MGTAISGIVNTYLDEKQKAWRKDHPFGFIACLVKNAHGTLNLMICGCEVSVYSTFLYSNEELHYLIKLNNLYFFRFLPQLGTLYNTTASTVNGLH